MVWQSLQVLEDATWFADLPGATNPLWHDVQDLGVPLNTPLRWQLLQLTERWPSVSGKPALRWIADWSALGGAGAATEGRTARHSAIVMMTSTSTPRIIPARIMSSQADRMRRRPEALVATISPTRDGAATLNPALT